MPRQRLRAIACAGLLALAATAAQAVDAPVGEIVRFDATRSEVGFRVKLVWLLGVGGRFERIEGDVRRDPFRNQLRVEARIDATSVRMASRSYEDWVKSRDFFDVERYPFITFASDPFPRSRLIGGGDVEGRLTLRGITQPVRFDLLPSACARPAFDCPIRVAGTIRRSMFGMGSHRGTLADKVELDFSVYALPSADPAPAPSPG